MAGRLIFVVSLLFLHGTYSEEPKYVLLAAVGRSGSTLTEHLIANLGKSFIVDEPWRHVSTQLSSMASSGTEADVILKKIDAVYKLVFSCDYLGASDAAVRLRKLVLDLHSCQMAQWVPKREHSLASSSRLTVMLNLARITACYKQWLSSSELGLGSRLCQTSVLRIIKTIRFRNQMAKLPPSLINRLYFVHLVRDPFGTARSRYEIGWLKGTKVTASHLKAAATSSDISEAEMVCKQILQTQKEAEASLPAARRILLRYEDVHVDTNNTRQQLATFFNLTIPTKTTDATQTRHMPFAKRAAAKVLIAKASETEWRNWAQMSAPECRAAYLRFYPEYFFAD